jgi:hypothetical protein
MLKTVCTRKLCLVCLPFSGWSQRGTWWPLKCSTWWAAVKWSKSAVTVTEGTNWCPWFKIFAHLVWQSGGRATQAHSYSLAGLQVSRSSCAPDTSHIWHLFIFIKWKLPSGRKIEDIKKNVTIGSDAVSVVTLGDCFEQLLEGCKMWVAVRGGDLLGK